MLERSDERIDRYQGHGGLQPGDQRLFAADSPASAKLGDEASD